MPWRGHDALYCKVCGKHRDEVGPLSARYKCASCGVGRAEENARQLKAHSGPYFQAWRHGILRSLPRFLPDDEQPRVTAQVEAQIAEEERRRALRRIR